MPRYKLTLEYDGTGLVGWQRQASGLSVQEILETAAERFCGKAVRVQGAGRTDAGVHALAQVAHLDLPRETDPEEIRGALNFHMRPHAVSVLAVEPVPATFNARTSARSRHYRYRILNRRAPPALEAGRVWHVPRPLDAQRMHEAAQLLVGRHDFTTFRAADCQARSPVKTLDRLDVARQSEELVIYASARSFLHHQVRSMVGTIEMAGAGRWTLGDVRAALEARDRTRCGRTAPAAGLCLIGVDYRPDLPSPRSD
jgi:tRNA pseudouridine38-40 synthase